MVLFRHRRFALLWFGQIASVVGDGMQRIALLWWAAAHGGTTLLVAIAISGIVPVVAVSPLGGWAADRYDRRTLLVGADLLRVATVLVLAVSIGTANPAPFIVCMLVALTEVGTAVFDPTYNAAVPTVVCDADLAAANGLNLANSAAGGLVGPVVGGLLLTWLDASAVLMVNAATFAWSAAFVAAVRLPRATRAAAAETTTRPLARDLVADPELRRLTKLAAVLNLVVAPVPLLIVTLAVTEFHAGPRSYGLLQATLSAGLLVGALAGGTLSSGRHALTASMIGIAASLMALATVPMTGAYVVLAVAGIAVAVANTTVITALQRLTQPELMGRVFGAVGAMSEALRPLGLLLAGPLIAITGIRGAFATIAIALALTTLTWARTSFAVRTGQHIEA
jgi:MFS family permease